MTETGLPIDAEKALDELIEYLRKSNKEVEEKGGPVVPEWKYGELRDILVKKTLKIRKTFMTTK